MAAISIPNAFSAQTKIESAKVNANFTEVQTKYNAHDTATTGVHGVGSGTILYTSMAATITNDWIFNNNIGIGGTPLYPLHINKSNAGQIVTKIRNTGDGYGLYISNNSTDASKYALCIGNYDESSNNILMYGDGKATFAGKVGIGTATVSPSLPSYRLHVAHSVASDVLVKMENTAINGYGVVIQNGLDTNYALQIRNSSGNSKISLFGNGQIESSIATGTAPLIVASSTVCTNLNADAVDGLHSTDIALVGHNHTTGSQVPTAGIANGAVTSAKASGILGAWYARTFGTEYTASTDLLVSAYATKAGADMELIGYTDTPNATTIRQRSSANSNYVSILLPVKKGENWKITRTAGSTDSGIFEIPIGS